MICSQLITGSYNNMFSVYNSNEDVVTTFEANKTFPKNQIKTSGGKHGKKKDDINPDSIDFSKKCLHMAWHPTDNFVAVGASNNLFLYEMGPPDDEDSD